MLKSDNNWFNNAGSDYELVFCKDDMMPTGVEGELVNNIIKVETSNCGWSLMHRFNMCND